MKSVILNYDQDFAALIKCGAKPHTIRTRRTDGRDPLPGDVLQHYVGWGTSDAHLLREEICELTIEVTIQPSAGNVHHILFGGHPLGQNEIEQLARADGFENADKFVRYFGDKYKLPFTGLLIGWAPTPVYLTRH